MTTRSSLLRTQTFLPFVGFAVFLVGILCFAYGCNPTTIKRSYNPAAKGYRIEQYSGGKLIATYETASFYSEKESDGYYFTVNGKLKMISGDVSVTEL